jgi:prepilin-type N-terminal cleavage/methylation domain-containing protein
MNAANTNKKGFTLLELLIVIAIIAVLAVLLIIVLDPAETLKRARDSQRVSDLNTLKTALGIYLTNTTTPQLGGTSNLCLGGSGTTPIAYSVGYTTSTPTCTGGATIYMGTDSVSSTLPANFCFEAASTTYTAVDGTGWIPVNFLGLSGGSPISNLPVDPVNTIANVNATPASTDLVYRYVCQSQTSNSAKPAHAYQIAAVLESALYGGTTGLASKDGAPNANYYQVGSDSRLTPPTSTVW